MEVDLLCCSFGSVPRGSAGEVGSVSAVPLRERSGHVVTAEMGWTLLAGSLIIGTSWDHAAHVSQYRPGFMCLWSLRSVIFASLFALSVCGWLHVVLRCLRAWHLLVQVVTGGHSVQGLVESKR